jgi:hypothetical protein
MVRAVVLAALLAGCSFDQGGLRVSADRGQLRELAAQDTKPKTEGVPLDAVRPDRPRDQTPVDQPPPQGTTCQNGGYTLSSSQPPSAGAKLTLQVKGPPQTWVLVGVATSSGPFGWTGKATHDGQIPTTWTFKGVPVPAGAGPFRYAFMANAQDDNPALGNLLATCFP